MAVRSVQPAYTLGDLAVGEGKVTAIAAEYGALEMPVSDGAVSGSVMVDEGFVSSGDRYVAWFSGPVSAGKWWIRARDTTGGTRWFRTMTQPITDITASGDQLWVATADQLTVFDLDGRVVFSIEQGATDLAAAPDGGVWVVDGKNRIRCSIDGQIVLSDEAMGGKLIAADGSWVGSGFKQLAVGRFGPEGQPRVVAQRGDGTIVSLDERGEPSLRINVHNDQGHSFAVGDVDGDGRDELLLSSFGHGVATLEVEIP